MRWNSVDTEKHGPELAKNYLYVEIPLILATVYR